MEEPSQSTPPDVLRSLLLWNCDSRDVRLDLNVALIAVAKESRNSGSELSNKKRPSVTGVVHTVVGTCTVASSLFPLHLQRCDHSCRRLLAFVVLVRPEATKTPQLQSLSNQLMNEEGMRGTGSTKSSRNSSAGTLFLVTLMPRLYRQW